MGRRRGGYRARDLRAEPDGSAAFRGVEGKGSEPLASCSSCAMKASSPTKAIVRG